MRLAFVVPRFAPGVLGGAEHHIGQLAGRLLRRGHDITVLTTCAVDHYTWANALPPGADRVDGIPVRRYPVTVARDGLAMARLQTVLDGGIALPPALEDEWVRNTGHSEPLLGAIADAADRVDALVFAPYLFASTVLGARVRPERSLIQPLLHDEAYARFACVQATLRGAAGILWISSGEREVAGRIIPGLPPGRVVGAGVDLPADPIDPERERRRLGLEGTVVSYAGRREGAKNFPLVAEAVTAANLGWGHRVTLAAMGAGPAQLPPEARPFVRDLGRVGDDVKLGVFAASTAVLNLSAVESLSYVVMEAWSVGTPVIVHAGCEVTRRHCRESGGGLWVRDVEEAVEAMLLLAGDPSLRDRLGAAGHRHVVRHLSWEATLDRFEAAVAELVPAPARTSP
jgi:glycosyltransferase involved in cell wall biosynthesis